MFILFCYYPSYYCYNPFIVSPLFYLKMSETQTTLISTIEDWFKWTSLKSKESIEKFKNQTQLPWWATLSSLTIALRLTVFPLRLRAWRNGRMMKMTIQHCNGNIAPKLREIHGKTLNKEVRNENFKKEMMEMNKMLMKSMGLSPWKSLTPLPVSIPLFLSVAAGLRMINYENEGLWWVWNNFGEAGIESAVPVALSNFLYIESSRRAGIPGKTGFLREKLPFILGHSVNILSFVLLTQVPSGVNFFLLNSSILSIIESKILYKKTLFDKIIEKQFNENINKINVCEYKKLNIPPSIPAT